MSAQPLLSVRNLRWAPPGETEPVLNGTTLDLKEGSLSVLIGPSGCGKSTLGYLIAGYYEAAEGEVRIDGKPVREPRPDRLMVFQESALWPWMSVLDNVVFGPLSRREAPRREIEAQAKALLEEFGLSAFANRYPHQLSGGMKRRVDLAQAVINQPRLLILDEPFRGLDVMTRELMQEYFLGLFEGRGQTTLFISSEVEEAVFLADEVLVMDQQGLIAQRLPVTLPRPRTSAMTDTHEFQKAQVDLLHALEAVQAETEGPQSQAVLT
ncbi:MAG: ATP-binding cassette domain-containing protein [Rhodovibrionaceae bacterium]